MVSLGVRRDRSRVRPPRRAGAVATPALVEVIADENQFQNELIDTLFRTGASEALTLMDAEAKRAAIDQFDRARRNSQSRSALQRLIAAERQVRLTGEPPAPPPRKEASPQDRAASLLNSAQNREKRSL